MNIIIKKLNQSILTIGNTNRIFSKKSPIKLIKRTNKLQNSFIIDTIFSIKKLDNPASRLLATSRKTLINQSLKKYQNLFIRKVKQIAHTNLAQACEIELVENDGASRNVVFPCSAAEKNLLAIDGIETSSMRQSQSNDYDIERLTLINKLFDQANDQRRENKFILHIKNTIDYSTNFKQIFQ
ncbi:hypothetical protein [Legionella rowbothamii]|uniref:hypothetical protein n=1 Tax=Legionella rowbothamii TaxID=96229 RepID=UPI0010555B8D|nr:hypothetical protein [Legionella rowbothamii]